MNRRSFLFLSLLLILSFGLSACIGLLPLEDEPITGEFGPRTSLQEQQSRTLEALWSNLEENYIYFETAQVDWDALREKYHRQVDAGLTAEEFTELVGELAGELPPGTLAYETRAQRIEREAADTATYEGIGAFVGFSAEPEPHIVLLDVIKGSPAERAGLKAHDSIFEIDGSPILLEEGMQAVERVRGPAGTSVTLGIQSPGMPQRAVEVERGRLASTSTLKAFKVREKNYVYLLFPPLAYEALQEDVVKSLQALTTSGRLEGLILDLRIAGSSRGWPLETMYTMLYNGALGEFYNRTDKQVIVVRGEDLFGSQDVPLVVLVGENTTGLPEVLAAGLQMHRRAIVIGETTPGAVETTTAFYLPDGSQAFIESASFALPNGVEVGQTGVVPDLSVEAGWDDVQLDQDPVLDQAIEYLDEKQ